MAVDPTVLAAGGLVRKTYDRGGADVSAARAAFLENSKVRHPHTGEPLVMWHGSPVKGFTEFDKTKINPNDPDALVNGFWFSSSKDEAERSGQFPWGRKNTPDAETRGFYLNIKNPASPRDAYAAMQSLRADGKPHSQSNVREELQRQGYDGYWHHKAFRPTPEQLSEFERTGRLHVTPSRWFQKNTDPHGGVDLFDDAVGGHVTGYYDLNDALQDEHDTVVAFEPHQIKLAKNNTTYDPTNAHIAKASGGSIVERIRRADGGTVMAPGSAFVSDDHPAVQQAKQILQQTPLHMMPDPPKRELPISSVIARGQPLNPRNPHPTDQQIAAARADSRVGGDIVNKRLDTIVPERERVAGGTYTPGAPSGGRWADEPAQPYQIEMTPEERSIAEHFERHLGMPPAGATSNKLIDQPGKGFKVTDRELDDLWKQSVDESSVAAKNAVEKHGVRPTFGARDWDEAMSLPLRDHLWYELSGEKMAENLPDLTAKQHMKFLDIIGATSARAKPDENLERSLGVLSQHMRGVPVDVDLTIPSTVRQALARDSDGTSALPGNKTGHFSDTLALTGGVPTRFPISVNDVWVGKMFGVPDDVMSSNQSLHEPMAKYFNKLRDTYNERMAPPFTYQSWNFQAPAWVHLRNMESGAAQGDAYHQVWEGVVNKLKDAGVPGIHGDQITREALMSPKFADALRRTTKPFRDAPKATVEFGTTQTPIGKRAHELYHQAIERGDELSQGEYLKGLTTAMYQSARGKNHPWDALKKAITGNLGVQSDITRIATPTSDAPLDIGGTFEGAVSPNIRIPLKDMSDAHIEAFNAIAGKHLRQDAMAVSQIHGAEQGSEPREGHIRGHSIFIPTTDQIPAEHLRSFAKEMGDQGHSMSFVRYPNGYHFDVLPRFGDDGIHGVTETQLDDAYGKTLQTHYGTAMVVPHDFRSVYTEAGDYDRIRKSLLKGFKDDYVQQAVAAGVPRRAALAAATAETPPQDFPRGGKEAWDVYRARHDHLATAEKGFKALAQRVADAHGTFISKAEKRFSKPVAQRDPDAPPFKRGGAVKRPPSVVPVTGRYANGGAVDHEPSDAQKSAGNYAKKRISFQGLPVSIENEAGSTRSGVDDRGKPWSCRVPADYGYIRGTDGADGDHVDCYVGRMADSPLVVVVNQNDLKSGRFDEHKCLLGFESERAALKCYCDGFSDGNGPDRVGSVEVMSLDAFKNWLKRGKTTRPAKSRAIVDRALDLVKGASA